MSFELSPPPHRVDEFGAFWKNWLYQLYLMVKGLYAARIQHESIQNAHFGHGTTAPTQVVIGNYNGWEFDIGDDSTITIELGHDVDDSKAIGLHFSFVVNEAYATASAEVRWQIAYSCTPNAGGEALNAPTHTGTVTTADINIPATAYHIYHVTTLEIPAGSYAHKDSIGIKFSRIALTAGVNPTAKPTVLTMHLEYTAQTTDWFSE